jgi:hypothetical protein
MKAFERQMGWIKNHIDRSLREKDVPSNRLEWKEE